MTLIAGQGLVGGQRDELSDKVADADIVQRNAAGQNVVVVAAGQPIPVRLLADELGAKAQRLGGTIEDKAVKAPPAAKAKAAKRKA